MDKIVVTKEQRDEVIRLADSYAVKCRLIEAHENEGNVLKTEATAMFARDIMQELKRLFEVSNETD